MAADCLSTAPGLIGWWSGDGTANNVFGTNNGVLQGGATANAAGIVGTAFSFDGTNSFVQIPDSPLLRPTNLTVETWVFFTSLDSAGSGGSPAGDQYLLFRQNTRSSDFEGFDLSKTRVGGSDVFRLLIASASAQTVEIRSSTTISTGAWYHVAAVRGSNFVQLFVNGSLQRQTNVTFAQDYGNFPWYFGTSGESFWDHKLKGKLDEVSIYGRALATNEIAAIYAAGAAGKCKAPTITTQPQSQSVPAGSDVTFTVGATGFGTLSYQWRSNQFAIAGATSTSLGLSNVQPSASGDYTVSITNSLGAITSAVATLTVTVPPSIVTDPTNQAVAYGTTATLAVAATGTAPLVYRWKKDTVPLTDDGRLSGTASSTLTISNVQMGDIGDYQLSVSNAYGTAASATANLAVVPVAIWGAYGPAGPPASLTNAMAIAAQGYQGERMNLGLKADGTIDGWGNYYDGFGNHNFTRADIPSGLANVVQVSTGIRHGLALKSDGSVAAFGDNSFGQTNVPPGLGPIISVAAGGLHSLLLKADGTVVGWGYEASPPTGVSNIAVITSGDFHSLAIRNDGTVTGWGLNWYGEADSPPGLTNVVAVSAGSHHSLALKSDGTVVAWGYDYYGESDVPPGLNNVVAIAAGYYHSMALKSDGTVVAWGNNDAGQASPPAGLANVVGIAAGNNHSVGLLQTASAPVRPAVWWQGSTNRILTAGQTTAFIPSITGSLPVSFQWYFNDAPLQGETNRWLMLAAAQPNQSGNYQFVAANSTGSATSLVAVVQIGSPPQIVQQPVSVTNVVGNTVQFNAAVAGTEPLAYRWFRSSAALTDDARHSGAGTTNLAITGLVTADAGNYTLQVSSPYGTITSAVATLTVLVPPVITTQPVGRSVPPGFPTVFTAAASGTGLGYQWQLNGTNIAGATQNVYTNPAVNLGNVGSYRLVVTNTDGSATSSVALLTIGPVAAWGNNQQRQCLPPPGLSNVIAVAGGLTCSVALRADGTVVAWGSGAGTNLPPNLTNIVAITMGSSDSGLALRSDGTILAWNSTVTIPASFRSNVVAFSAGYGFDLAVRAEGVLGAWVSNGSFPGNSPPQVTLPPGLTGVIDAAAGVNQGIALREDGTVAVWGASSATNPPALSNAVAVGSGFNHTIALTVDGKVTAWGTGASTNLPKNLTNVTAIAVGSYAQGQSHDLAILSNGTVVVWGDNGFGETNTPPALSNLVTVAVAGGGYHSLALVNDGAPLILRPPVGRTAFAGRDVALSAAAAGAAPLSFQWLRNGTNLPGATQTRLSLALVSAADAGSYQLVVSNALGVVASVPALLTVLDGPPFFIQSLVQTNSAFLGTRFAFTSAIGGSGPLQYKWLFNGQELPGATSDTLVFNRAQNSNSGTYTLTVSNSFGSVTSAVANLSVISVVAWGTFDIFYNETNTPAILTNATAVSAGPGSSLALRADGTALAWGHYQNGETNIPSSLSNLVEIAAGPAFNLALRADGRVLGFGNITTNLSNLVSNIVALEADQSGSTFLRPDGTIARLSNNNTLTFPAFGTNVVALNHYISGYGLLRADGTLLLSGNLKVPVASNVLVMAGSFSGIDNELLLLRDGSVQGAGRVIGAVGISNAIDVAVNSSIWAAVRSDGTVGAWGAVGPRTNIPSGLANVTMLEGGQAHLIALLNDRVFPPIFLSDALNTPALVLSSKTSPQWFGQAGISHDGLHAAQSAPIDKNTASSMRALVAGPCMVRYWWKVSSETNHDFLAFSIGGVPQAAISGEQDWQQATFNVPPGPQMLVWTYSKDSGGSAGLDAAWVDQLEIIPIAPSILSQPLSQTVLRGSNVNFTVGASGTPPLSYQWRKNEAAITNPPATTSLTLTNVTRTNSGSYSVVITNVAGAVTSSPAALVVHVPQQIRLPVFQSSGTFLLLSGDTDGGSLSSNNVASFHLQASTNLVDWSSIPAVISLTNGLLLIQDTNASLFRNRFYRVVEDW